MRHSRFCALILLMVFVTAGDALAQKAKAKKPAAKAQPAGAGNEEKVRDLVAFFQLLLNTLGSNNTSARDKEIVITESYAKVFRDDKVQVEDDLEASRSVITNKDVVAYLKDVDFFFRDARFEFTIDDITQGVNANGQTFYKVSMRRNLKGTTVDGKEITNTIPRFIEVNYDPRQEDLKIVSIYTNEFDEKEALTNWWKGLSLEWQQIFRTRLNVTDSVDLEDIKDMVALNELDLTGNKFIQNIDPLAGLTSLKLLSLAETGVEDLTPIRNLTELVELNLARTKVFDLSPLKYATRLERLNISDTEIRSIEVLEKMSAMKNLEMRGTDVFDFEALSALTQLINLDLEETVISNLDPVDSLSQLMELNISRTPVQDVTALGGLENLVSLDLDSTLIRDMRALSGLPRLEEVHANYTFITDLGPLLQLPKLERVYCDQTPVNKMIADRFMAARPDVLIIYDSKDLQAWWNSISADWKQILSRSARINITPGKEELARVTNLDSINISNHASVKTLEPLRKLLKLKAIVAGNTEITDLSPLHEHRELRYLDISDTRVSDISPVSKFSKLKIFRADRSSLEDIQGLFGLKALEAVYVDRTAIHDITAREFLERNPNCLIVYKTVHLDRWWDNLPEEWKDVFQLPQGADTTHRREHLHRLVEQESFRFRDAPVRDLSPFGEFVRLKELHFSATGIAEIPDLESLRSLRSLHATSSPLQRIGFISQLGDLHDLDISNTPIDELKGLEGLGNLTSLNCAGTQVKRLDPLKPLHQLENFDCSNTRVSKLDPVMFLSLRNLKCYNTKVSAREVDQFRDNNPECHVVYYR